MRTQPQGWHQDDWTGVLKWQVRNRMISKMAPSNLGKICLGTFLLSLLARSGKCFKLLPLVKEQEQKQEQNYDLHLPSLSHLFVKRQTIAVSGILSFRCQGDIFTSEEISRQAWTFPKLSCRRHNNKNRVLLSNIAVALSNIFLVNKSQASWIILSCTCVSSTYYSYIIIHWIKGFKLTNLINWWTALQLICVQRQFWTSAEVTLRRFEIFQHLVLKPITLFAQNGRSRFQQLEELKDWITDRPFLHWLWIWYYMIISNFNWWCTGPFWWRRLVQIFPF